MNPDSMFTLILSTAILALLCGAWWHNKSARGQSHETEEVQHDPYFLKE